MHWTWTLIALLGCPTRTVEKPPEAPASTPAPTGPDTVGDLVIVPIYHATVALTAGGKTWIADPWSKGPLAGHTADVILITDIHQDHLDPVGIEAVSKPGTLVVGPPAVGEKIHLDVVIANGETKDVAGVSVTAVPMYNIVHGPEPGKLYHDPGRGDGYRFELGGQQVYIAGDTECTPEMKALTGVDVAFVPMNLPYTMSPEEAAACVAIFRPAVVYPYHYSGSDLSHFAADVGPGIEVRIRDWYPETD